jgi:hypothetical protein
MTGLHTRTHHLADRTLGTLELGASPLARR